MRSSKPPTRSTSGNEKLQSTNEELETSKEQLQSYNEELHTINAQLQHKLMELEEATNDLTNLLAGTEVATLFLDTHLRIKWFSPAMKELFDLLSSDVGRPIANFAPKFADATLEQDAARILQQLVRTELEVLSTAGRWYLRRMIPYRTQSKLIAGVVVTFTDITERKRAQDAISEARVYAEAIVETVRQPLLVLDATLTVVSANRCFFETYKLDRKATEGRLLYELGNRQWDSPQLRPLLASVLKQNQPLEAYKITHISRTLGHRTMLLNATKLTRDGHDPLILLAIEDIPERAAAEQELQLAMERTAVALTAGLMGIFEWDIASDRVVWSDEMYLVFGIARAHFANTRASFEALVHPDDRLTLRQCMQEIFTSTRPDYEVEFRVTRGDGKVRWVQERGRIRRDPHGAAERVLGVRVDITERKRSEERQRLLTNELAHRGKNLLSVIQSIASRTLSGNRPLAQAREVFVQRLQALARTYSVTDDGALEGAPLGEIVRLELENFAGRVEADGPNLTLSARAAQSFALIVHELATNAAKYGALSGSSGRVRIHWSVDTADGAGRLKFRWQERGGPPVTPSSERGFGSMLLEQMAAQEFQAPPRINFAPTGLIYELDVPLSSVVAVDATRETPGTT
jgi:two-component system, chemotaxis family, CheB/CheR fusion protein